MPIASKQKRKPFGTASRNEVVNRNQNYTATSRPGKENDALKSTSADASPHPRRDSKTPKASNLTTIGGAYGLGDDFFGMMNPTRKKKHAKTKKNKPDPSPLKKPDPTATTKSIISSKQPKGTSSVTSIFSLALKRSKSDHAKKRDAKGTTSAVAAITMNNSPSSDMDTACSTPEKESPLITSPCEKPDPPTRSSTVVAAVIKHAQKQKELSTTSDALTLHDRKVVEQEQGKKRPAPQFAANNEHAGNRTANLLHPSAAPMAPLKKKDADTTPAVAAVTLNYPNNGHADNKEVMEAMMNSGKDGSEESCVVGSFVGGTSLQRSHSEDLSEMTMMDDNVSTTSMTTLGGNNSSTIAHAKKKENSPSSTGDIPSQLNLHRVDTINTRQVNLIDEETIASHITNQLKPGGQLQPVDRSSLSTKSYLPAGWKECFSKTKNRPFWKHPDWGSTWYNPGLSVALTDAHLQSTQQNVELNRARQPESSGASHKRRTDDESMAASNEIATKENIDDQTPQAPQENGTDDVSSASSHSAKKPDPTPLRKPDPTATTATSHTSHQKQPTSPNAKRISEDYQQLLAPYQSVEKSVASKALSVASSRHSKASSSGDISSKCLTQEFAVTKDEEEVGAGTPSIGNSVGELDNDDDPDEFDYAHDDEGYDEDDLMNDRQSLADLNSLASDHVDIDALLTQRRNESPMSTIRETLNESAVDPSPSSAVSTVEFGNDDDMSQGSDNVKSSAGNNSDHDGHSLSSNSSADTLSKSAIKDANAGETLSDDDLDGESPIFESNEHDVDESDDDVEVSQHHSRRKGATFGKLDLSLDLKKESRGSNDYSKRKFFPPGPLCSLQFLDEIEEGEFDTPLWRRMKRKRSTYTSVKKAKAVYKAKKLLTRQSR